MTGHTGMVEQSGTFAGKGLGYLRDAVNVVVPNFSEKRFSYGTEHSIWKDLLEKFLDTNEDVVLPEGVIFETSMLNALEKSEFALVLPVLDQVFQQTLSPESKAKKL
jgi:hypothetical protein